MTPFEILAAAAPELAEWLLSRQAMSVDEALRVLRLEPGATREQIQRRRRELARDLHPDLNPGLGDEPMKEVNNAADTLIERGTGGGESRRPSGPPRRPQPRQNYPREEYHGDDYRRSDIPPWETDGRASYSDIRHEHFSDLNYCKKKIWEEAKSSGAVREMTIWAFDGSYFRGVFSVYANENVYPLMAEAMRVWNGSGNPYATKAVLVAEGRDVKIIWTSAEGDVDEPIDPDLMTDGDYEYVGFNSQDFQRWMRKRVQGPGDGQSRTAGDVVPFSTFQQKQRGRDWPVLYTPDIFTDDVEIAGALDPALIALVQSGRGELTQPPDSNQIVTEVAYRFRDGVREVTIMPPSPVSGPGDLYTITFFDRDPSDPDRPTEAAPYAPSDLYRRKTPSVEDAVRIFERWTAQDRGEGAGLESSAVRAVKILTADLIFEREDEDGEYTGDLPDFEEAIKRPDVVEVARMDEPFEVDTLEGRVEGEAGDYLVRGHEGEMWPIDKDVFESTYTMVDGMDEQDRESLVDELRDALSPRGAARRAAQILSAIDSVSP